MASSSEPSHSEDDYNLNKTSSEKSPPPPTTPPPSTQNNNTLSSPPPPPPPSPSPPPPNSEKNNESPSPTTSPSPDNSPPPPPSPTSSPPPPPPSPSPPPPGSPPPQESTSPPPPAPPPPPSPPPPAHSPPPPPKKDDASPPTPPPPVDSPPPPHTSPPPPSPAHGSPPPIKGPTTRPPTTFSTPPPGAISSQRPPSGNGVSSSGNSPPSGPGSDVAIIAGVIVGGIAILALIIICLTCSRKKKRQRYYMDPQPGGPQGKGGDQFFNDQQQWQGSRPGDQVINLPPPPGFAVAAGSGGVWGAPLVTNPSTEFNSGYLGQNPTPAMQQPQSPSIGTNMSQFRYEDLVNATGGFSQENLLGQGGFGYVHMGILPDKREVAVKSLKTGSGQGEREFQAEVEIISRVHHRHLVSLVGYCIANEQRLLVYEYVANKTLEFHLHGKGQPVMPWSTRLKIGVGSAKGLAYLHEDCHPRIIHRDIKAANILLDNNFEAMVADFGLAKLTSDNYTHVSTRVMGTFGYLAPEYASSGKLSEKSDVFSFGVMLLELITGRRPVDTTNRTMEDSLVDWARPLLSKALEDGNYNQLVDPRLEGNYVTHELSCMVACAAASIRHSARRRPKMSQIAHALEGDSSLDDLNEDVKPEESKAYNPAGTGGSTTYDTMAYNADMLKFKKMVLSSQEFNSSEYGATSEFGRNPSSSSDDNSTEIPKATADQTKKLYA